MNGSARVSVIEGKNATGAIPNTDGVYAVFIPITSNRLLAEAPVLEAIGRIAFRKRILQVIDAVAPTINYLHTEDVIPAERATEVLPFGHHRGWISGVFKTQNVAELMSADSHQI